MGLSRFNREFDKAMTVSIKGSEKVIKEGVTKLFSKIIKDTPVDTGQLRGNWQTSLNTPITEELLGTLDLNGFKSISKVGAVISRLNFTGREEVKMFMSNNLGYANRIEFGQHSSQAPYGMVRINVLSFKTEIDKAANKFRR